jgi:membrane-associated phospholipid phosphatase
MLRSLAIRPSTLGGPLSNASHSGGKLTALAFVLAVLACAALSIDISASQFVRAGRIPGDLARLIRLSETFAYGGTVMLIILLAVRLDHRAWRIAPRLAINALGAGLIADAVKLIVARQRPSAADLEGPVLDTFAGWLPLAHGNHRLQSFPSAHAATAVGLAIALSTLYPRGCWLFALLAMLAGLQRVESQSHFLSDVLAGAAIGCLMGAACLGRGPIARWLTCLEHPAAGPVA